MPAATAPAARPASPGSRRRRCSAATCRAASADASPRRGRGPPAAPTKLASGLTQRDALHALARREVVDPDLRARPPCACRGRPGARARRAGRWARARRGAGRRRCATTPARSASSKSGQRLAEAQRRARDVDGWTSPSNETKSHSLPRRTAFSVSGSFCGSKNGVGARDVSALPGVVERHHERRAVGAQHEEAARAGGVDEAAAGRRDLGDEAPRAARRRCESDVTGVRLKTARKRPSSESALAALPGKYSARFGGIPISASGCERAARRRPSPRRCARRARRARSSVSGM